MLKVLGLFSVLPVAVLSLEWNPDVYKESVANHTLMFAYSSYCPKSQIKAWNCPLCQQVPGFQVDTVFEAGDLLAFVGWDNDYKQVVAAFRGTTNTGNAVTDMNMLEADYPGVDGGRVHMGFYNAWNNVLKPVILPAMKKLMDKHFGAKLLVTGHSLGAALGQIASLEMFGYANATGNPGFRRVEDFGSPRWGNSPMVAYFESLTDSHWRVVNVHDIVPKIPYGFGYVHTKHEVHYTSDAPLKYQVCDGSGEDPACGYWQGSISDHNHYMNIGCCCDGEWHA